MRQRGSTGRGGREALSGWRVPFGAGDKRIKERVTGVTFPGVDGKLRASSLVVTVVGSGGSWLAQPVPLEWCGRLVCAGERKQHCLPPELTGNRPVAT